MLIHGVCYGHRSPIAEHHGELVDAVPPNLTTLSLPTWVLNSVEQWSCEGYLIMLRLGTPLFHRRPRKPGTALWLINTNNRKRPAQRCREETLSFTGVNSNIWGLSWGTISKQASTIPPPLTLDNSSRVVDPHPLKELSFRTHYVSGGEPDYL